MRLIFIIAAILTCWWLCPAWWPLWLIAIAFSPGCTCCGSTCTIYTDNFATNTLSTSWTTATSGIWSISGGVMSCSTTSGYRIATAQHPLGIQAMIVKADVTGSTNDLARIIGGWKDASNFIYGEVKIGSSGFIRLIQVSGGASTTLASSVGSFGSATYTLCISSDGLTATFFAPNTGSTTIYASHSVTAPTTPSGAGVGTGTTAAGITFDNFSAVRTDSTCTAVCSDGAIDGCNNCPGNIRDKSYTLTIAGVTNGTNGTCTDCSNFDQTFVMPLVAGTCAGGCLNLPVVVCNTFSGTQFSFYEFIIQTTGTSPYFFVGLPYSGGSGCAPATDLASFDNSGSPLASCLGASASLTRTGGTDAFCNFSAATVMVTS